MAERTKNLDDTIKRTKEAEKELGTLVKQSKADLDHLEEAEDRIVAKILGEMRDHPKEPPDASQPEDLVD